MTTPTDSFDLGALGLDSGEARRFDIGITIEPFELGSDHYTVSPEPVPASLEISRMTSYGYALALAFSATLTGPCMRCLGPAAPEFSVRAREVSQPGEGDDEFESPYVNREQELDVAGWAHDALALALPPALLCKPDCLGLCAVCGIDLNTADPEHMHEAGPDPRWAVLAELKLDETPSDPC